MKSLHNKNWFKIYTANAGYDEEEVELLWQSLTTDQLDLLQVLIEKAYEQGTQQGRDETMC